MKICRLYPLKRLFNIRYSTIENKTCGIYRDDIMTKYIIGVDSGSTMCKSVLFDGEKIVDTLVVKTGWNPKLSSEESISSLLTRNGINRLDVCLSTTG